MSESKNGLVGIDYNLRDMVVLKPEVATAYPFSGGGKPITKEDAAKGLEVCELGSDWKRGNWVKFTGWDGYYNAGLFTEKSGYS